jgi:hypothetical protein
MRVRNSCAVLSRAGLAPSGSSAGVGELPDDERDDEGDDGVGEDGEAAVGRSSS